jgi:transposase
MKPDRPALCGIPFVLHTGIARRHLPPQLGFGSGITCSRRLDEWQRAGVWDDLHTLLLADLRACGITPQIARRGTKHGSGLGTRRWVVERSFAWLYGFRRLLVRCERRADIA